jgi:hypothetical protein
MRASRLYLQGGSGRPVLQPELRHGGEQQYEGQLRLRASRLRQQRKQRELGRTPREHNYELITAGGYFDARGAWAVEARR